MSPVPQPLLRLFLSFLSVVSLSPDTPVSVAKNPVRVGRAPIIRLRGFCKKPLEIRLCDRYGRPLVIHPVTPTSKDFVFVLPVTDALRAGMYQVVVDSIGGEPVCVWVAMGRLQRPIASR